MTEPIKVFAIFKNNKKEKDNQPDYTMSAKIGDKYQDIGGCWIKEGVGGKFFSCKLRNPSGTYAGFHLEIEVPPFKEVETP